jgi:platelet-activating factor acetylhydrolase IB subunit beta/gamma
MSGLAAGALSRVLNPVPPAKPSSVKRLAEIQRRIPDAADVILLGDSLVAAWPDTLVGEAFPNRRVWNFGLPGDRIQNTLWRLQTVPTAHLRPREVVLLLGTNNLGDGDAADEIAEGLVTLLRGIAELWGSPRVFLVTIPGRGEPPGFRNETRLAIRDQLVRDLAARPDTILVDADDVLAAGRDEASSLLPDLLHISEAGYARLSAAVAVLTPARAEPRQSRPA